MARGRCLRECPATPSVIWTMAGRRRSRLQSTSQVRCPALPHAAASHLSPPAFLLAAWLRALPAPALSCSPAQPCSQHLVSWPLYSAGNAIPCHASGIAPWLATPPVAATHLWLPHLRGNRVALACLLVHPAAPWPLVGCRRGERRQHSVQCGWTPALPGARPWPVPRSKDTAAACSWL